MENATIDMRIMRRSFMPYLYDEGGELGKVIHGFSDILTCNNFHRAKDNFTGYLDYVFFFCFRRIY